MIRLHLPSDLACLSQIDDIIETIKSQFQINDTIAHLLMMAFHEGITNAILHGNKLDPNKSVEITIEKIHSDLSITISDEGDGFNPNQLPDPTDESNVMKSGGRGVFLIQKFADKVEYNEKGNTVNLIYHLNSK
jgi:serine/threonine-protein kinase RsbW